MAEVLCKWRRGDEISAYRLNLMTEAINTNLCLSEETASLLGDSRDLSAGATGGLNVDGRFISGLEPMFTKQNRGVVLTEWDVLGSPDSSDTVNGVYIRKSGIENALTSSYPCQPCLTKIQEGVTGHHGKDILQKVITDEYGNVKCSTYVVSNSSISEPYKLWQGPSNSTSDEEYQFYRRVGRIIDSCVEMSEGSIPINVVMETNDLVMPILPVRAAIESKGDSAHSVSTVGNFIGNSVRIKNITNEGGLALSTNDTAVKMRSGIEFYKGEVSSDSTGSEEITYPTIAQHTDPESFNVNIACIPVKEQHYKWCSSAGAWKPVSSGDSTCTGEPLPVCKGSIKINANTFNGNNWQIGFATSGGIEIPVYDFTPSDSTSVLSAGRAIQICKRSTTDADGNIISCSIINNTMKICAGCGITVAENCDGYIINGKEVTLVAGSGISVSNNGDCWTITNTATHNVVYSSSTPSPNNCGWVMTMLLCNVAMQIPTTTCYMPMYYRQLMRFKCNNLEVSYQYKTSEGGNWQRGPLPSMASLTSMTSLE